MDLETALTFTHGHFNEVVFAVYYIGTLSTKGMYTIASKKKMWFRSADYCHQHWDDFNHILISVVCVGVYVCVGGGRTSLSTTPVSSSALLEKLCVDHRHLLKDCHGYIVMYGQKSVAHRGYIFGPWTSNI